jgi:hypothetical protein
MTEIFSIDFIGAKKRLDLSIPTHIEIGLGCAHPD